MSPKYNLISPPKRYLLGWNDHASSACNGRVKHLKHNGKTTRQQTGTPYPWYNSYGCSIKRIPKKLPSTNTHHWSVCVQKGIPMVFLNMCLNTWNIIVCQTQKTKIWKQKTHVLFRFPFTLCPAQKNRLSASFFRICTQQLPTQISSFGQSWPWMFCPISCVCLMVDRVSMVTFCALGGISLQEWLCPKL